MLSVPKVRAFVPLLKVRDPGASSAFYEEFGFTVSNSFTPDGASEPRWVSMTCGDVELMLGRASRAEADVADEFYLYSDDVGRMHSKLRERGVEVTPIAKPPFNPGGEFDVVDPDGRVIHIA